MLMTVIVAVPTRVRSMIRRTVRETTAGSFTGPGGERIVERVSTS
jgi:hypothetical protein